MNKLLIFFLLFILIIILFFIYIKIKDNSNRKEKRKSKIKVSNYKLSNEFKERLSEKLDKEYYRDDD